MSKNVYLALADQGKNSWLRYLASIFLIVLIFVLSNGLIIGFALELGWFTPGTGTLTEFVLSLLTFLPMLLGVFLINGWLHRRSVGSLIGPAGRLNLRRIALGVLIWGGLFLLFATIEAVLYGNYTFNPAYFADWPFLLASLLLVPVQTSAEEFLYRGYLLQASGRLTQNPMVLSVINGILFTLPHLANPETGEYGWYAILSWFVFGAGYTLITLRSGSLDYALGGHAINNILSMTIVGYEGGAVSAPTLFVNSQINPLYGLLTNLVALAITYWLVSRLESQTAVKAAAARA
ncbi:type II CAAX endopeptidase family protein [Bellilinea sp.]|uniref:CPBP family intramembrane glutamic endopeptidase n=1 Tax=Bellilinea sp. TaxID=2838785 RepID=UPI002ADD3E7C|nr:type II CAAX endopeptidase family protein [Bellilinea sp.]